MPYRVEIVLYGFTAATDLRRKIVPKPCGSTPDLVSITVDMAKSQPQSPHIIIPVIADFLSQVACDVVGHDATIQLTTKTQNLLTYTIKLKY